MCLRHLRFFGSFPSLALATCLLPAGFFWEPQDAMVARRPKARFNANQQQKIAKAQPSGAFKEGGKFDLQKTSKIQIE